MTDLARLPSHLPIRWGYADKFWAGGIGMGPLCGMALGPTRSQPERQSHDLVGRHAWPQNTHQTIKRVRAGASAPAFPKDDFALPVDGEFNAAARMITHGIAYRLRDGDLALGGDSAHRATRS
jgi:hypothetical protein